MSPEQQRIKIAEAVGWTPTPTGWWTMHPSGIPTGEYPAFTDPPDYLKDLNAMHEAEKVLVGRNNWELCDYVHKLHATTNGWPAFATAAQRAEAFLRTLNLWKE